MLDQAPAATITTADLTGWLVGGALTVLGVLLTVIGWFLNKLHDRFEGHLKDASKRDEEIEQLKIAVARAEEKHGETTRNLVDLKLQLGELGRKVDGQITELGRKVDGLPNQIAALLTARREG